MNAALIETFNFGFSLLALPALYFIVAMFIGSPFVVAGWGLNAIRGRPNPVFADTSEQARLNVVVNVVTTALAILLAAWMMGVI